MYGAIVGFLAEAYYGIDNSYIAKANEHLLIEFIKVLKKAYQKMN